MRLRTSSATTTAISLSKASRLNMVPPEDWPQRHRATEKERRKDRVTEKKYGRSISPPLRLSLSLSLFLSFSPSLWLCGSVADFSQLFEIQPESGAFGVSFDLLQNFYG